MILGNLSLILEGGGMRGMFSAGVPATYFRICPGKRGAQGG